MTPLLDSAVLATDLDAQGFAILNLGLIDPPPPNLVSSDDPRLDDPREPAPGSVTDASVAAGAGIVQSKLNLNGEIPSDWLGTLSNTAARGDLAEYLSNKNQPNGYVGLDGSGKVSSSQLPPTAGFGTVSSVDLTMPAEFSVTGGPVTGAGTLAVTWADVSDLSWFGNKEGAPGPPQFYTDPFPASLIPDLSSSQITSGVFDPALLPVAIGLGSSHAPGAVPDPGDGSGGALATDYLARDMTYKPRPTIGPTYQPTIPDPTLGASTNPTGAVKVSPSSTVPGAVFFYSLVSSSTAFQEFPDSGYVSLPSGDEIWVYAAHSGYNNSNVVNMTNSNPP